MSSVAQLETAPKADFETAAKVDNFLCSSVPWQDGHAGAGEELRTNVSNSLLQDAHLNSNIGMTVSPRKFLPLQVYGETLPPRPL